MTDETETETDDIETALKFTHVALKGLKARNGKRTDYTDISCPGLRLRVSPTGTKTFVFVARIGGRGGSVKRVTIGRFPRPISLDEAHRQALGFQSNVAKAEPLQSAKQASPFYDVGARTFDEVADEFEDHIKPTDAQLAQLAAGIKKLPKGKKKSWENDVGYLKRPRKRWGRLPFETITTPMVVELLKAITKNGDGRGKPAPVSANRTHSILHSLFGWGKQQTYIAANPLADLGKLNGESERERVLDREELRVLWFGLDDPQLPADRRTALALKLMILTAQRPGEVASIHSVVQHETHGAIWCMKNTKNGRDHWVPLTAMALEVIEEAKSLGDGDGIFDIVTRTMSQAVNGKPATKHNKARIGIYEFLGMEKWTPHDLRRTGATNLGEAEYDDPDIDRLQNHTQRGMGKVYNKAKYMRLKREMVEVLESVIADIIREGSPRRAPVATPQPRRRTTQRGSVQSRPASGTSRRRSTRAA